MNDAYERKLIWDEAYKELIWQRITATHFDADIKRRIRPFISISLNAARDIVNAIAVVYKLGARRMLIESDEATDRAYKKIVLDTKIKQLDAQWNKWAFFLGPLIVVPTPRFGRISYETLFPHQYEPVLNPFDPLGTPEMVAWTIHNGQIREPGKSHTIVLDRIGWYYFDVNGRPATDISPNFIAHNGVDEDGAPVFPGVVHRYDVPQDPDWWSRTRNERLKEATIEIGAIWSVFNWVRKSQNKKLLTIVGNIEGMPQGQKNDPERPLVFDSVGAEAIQMNALDFDTPPGNFLQHIKFTYEQQIEAFGIAQSSVTFDTAGKERADIAVNIEHDRLAHVRNEQIPFAREFESELAWKTVAVAIGAGIDVGPLSVETVKEKHLIEFPDLQPIGDPIKMLKVQEWERRHMYVNDIDLIMRRHPDLTREQAKKWLEDRINEQAEINDLKMTNNMMLNPDQVFETAPQAIGATGPGFRDESSENRPEASDE